MNKLQSGLIMVGCLMVVAYASVSALVVCSMIIKTANHTTQYLKNDYRASTYATEPSLIGDTVPPCTVSGLEYVAGWCHE